MPFLKIFIIFFVSAKSDDHPNTRSDNKIDINIYLSTSNLIWPPNPTRATKKLFSIKQTMHQYRGSNFVLFATLHSSLLGCNAFIASLLCRKGKQGIKSKLRAIKCCKENKVTAPPNEWCNIPFCLDRIEQRSAFPNAISREPDLYRCFVGTLLHCVREKQDHT